MIRIAAITAVFIATAVFSPAAQDSLSGEDPFDTGAFDQAVKTGAAADSQNRLEYLPGVFFATEAAGLYSPDDKTTGSDLRFYGKAFVKASRADIGALYLGANFNYFLYAAAANPYYRALYQFQSPDPARISASLSEFHFSLDVKKAVFIRVGSQLISWGASYFWSPADFINQQRAQAAVLNTIDTRSGKPGVRIHIPLEMVNIFLFTDFSGMIKRGAVGTIGEGIAQAWRIDGTVMGVNLGTVGYVASNKPVQIGFDATGNLLGSDIYGELATGFKDTAGVPADYAFSVGGSRALGQEREWTVRGEFYYNNRGYEETDLSLLPPGAFTPLYSGKYYAYAEVSGTKLFTPVLGAALFWYANLADLSYCATLQLTISVPGVLPFSVYGRYFGGGDDREFTSAYGGRSVQGGLRVRGEF